MSSPVPDLIGQLIDQRYRVLQHIADGGMASVFRALDERLDREVALKLMRPDLARDAAFVARFRREAKAAARLSHPHVVGVYDQGQDSAREADTVFLAMEYVPGHTLREVLHEHAPMPVRQAMEVFDPIVQALAAAHRAGIVHRDVKPENVLIGPGGVIKVADFGLARALSSQTETTHHGVLLGTAAYLAPELLEHGTCDQRSDVYAASLLLFELLTDKQAFSGQSPIHVAYQHVHGPVPVPSRVLSSLPTEVDALVGIAAAKDPADRPRDAGEYLLEVRRVRSLIDPTALGASVVPAPDWAPPETTRMSTAGRADARSGRATQVLGGVNTTTALRQPPVHATEQPTAPPVADTAGVRARADRQPEQVDAPASGASALPPDPSGQRARRPWGRWLGAAVLVVALSIGGWFWLGPGAQVTLPTVATLPRGEALSVLDQAGLRAQIQQDFSETVPSGRVIGTDPQAGTRLRRSEPVLLHLSQGPERFTVPELTGLTQAQAVSRLRATRLSVGEVSRRYDDTAAEGTVLASSPQRGQRLKAGATVALQLSQGPPPIAVPQVSGQSATVASERLRAVGFNPVLATERVFDATVPVGNVVRQEPAEGTAVRGTRITLTLSKGPDLVSVPSVVGQSGAAAKQTLEAAGFGVEVRTYFGGWLDTVRAQDPEPGTRLKRGATVVISVV